MVYGLLACFVEENYRHNIRKTLNNFKLNVEDIKPKIINNIRHLLNYNRTKLINKIKYLKILKLILIRSR